jgi:hypothetical protein
MLFYFRRIYCLGHFDTIEGFSMDRFILASLALATSVAPAFAGVAVIQVPEPATMTLFGLGVGGVYLAKRFIGRK